MINLIEQWIKIKILLCIWSQRFPIYFTLQLKNGLPPVLKAGSGKNIKVFFLNRKKWIRMVCLLMRIADGTLFLEPHIADKRLSFRFSSIIYRF